MRETWAGKIPWSRARQPTPVFLPRESSRTKEPGKLQPMGSQRVGHDWAANHSTSNRFPNLGIWQRGWESPGNSVGFDSRTSTGLGKQDSWRVQTKPLADEEPEERNRVSTRSKLAYERPAISSRGVDQQWPAVGSETLNTTMCAQVLLKEATLPSLPLTQFRLRPKNREGTEPWPSTGNWIKHLLSKAPPIRRSFPPS